MLEKKRNREGRDIFLEGIKKELENAGVNYHSPDYLGSDCFTPFKDRYFISGPEGKTTYREIIERYLLDDEEKATMYKSRYEMGNGIILKDEECQYSKLAEELCKYFNNEVNVDPKEFYRNGGLRDRIKNGIGMNLDFYKTVWDTDNNTSLVFKILFLFYRVEHVEFSDRNVIKMLSKPSMENVDNSAIGMYTSNGSIMNLLKENVEREISVEFRGKVKQTLCHIVTDWEKLIKEASMVMDIAYANDTKCELDNIIRKYNKVALGFQVKEKPESYHLSPIELLYLKLAQHENIGRENDIIFVNSIDTTYQTRTDEQIKIMNELQGFIIERNKAGEYIRVYVDEICELVYLRYEVSEGETQRIISSIEKVETILDFFASQTKMYFETDDKINVTFIISCLQAIILSEQSEKFMYKFPAYDKVSRSYKRVQGALKGDDKIVFEALKTYFVRKVMECYNCNIGRQEGKEKLTIVENICDTLLQKILHIPDIETMITVHDYYVKAISDDIIAFPQRKNALHYLTSELMKLNYEYVDPDNQIGEMFFDSAKMKDSLDELIDRLKKRIDEEDKDDVIVSFDYEVCNIADESAIKKMHVEFCIYKTKNVIRLDSLIKHYSERLLQRFKEFGIQMELL